MGKEDALTEVFSRYLTGFALSKAILEDYIKVVAKLENISEQEVKDRVWNRSEEIFKDTIDTQRKQFEG